MTVGPLRGLRPLGRVLEVLHLLCQLVLESGPSVPVAKPLDASEMVGIESEYFVLAA